MGTLKAETYKQRRTTIGHQTAHVDKSQLTTINGQWSTNNGPQTTTLTPGMTSYATMSLPARWGTTLGIPGLAIGCFSPMPFVVFLAICVDINCTFDSALLMRLPGDRGDHV